MIKFRKRNDSLVVLVMSLAIILTIFSQMLNVLIIKILMYFFWALSLFVLFLVKNKSFFLSMFFKRFLLCYLLFIIYCCFLSLFIPNYLSNNYLQLLYISLLMTLLGYNIFNNEIVKKILVVYVFSSFIFAIYIRIKYFSSLSSWMLSESYLFVSKNSAAQIWGSAILFIYYMILPTVKKKLKIMYILISMYILFVVFLSQCKTAILGLMCVLCITVFVRCKHKITAIGCIALMAFFVIANQNINMFFRKVFNINKYNFNDLNSLSSGRLDYYLQTLDIIKTDFIFGVGKYYVDCSYLSIFAESGILGLILIEIIWLTRTVINIRYYHRKKSNINLLLIALTAFYFIESLFEGFPPFGPGATSFMFWIYSSYCDRLNYEDQIKCNNKIFDNRLNYG